LNEVDLKLANIKYRFDTTPIMKEALDRTNILISNFENDFISRNKEKAKLFKESLDKVTQEINNIHKLEETCNQLVKDMTAMANRLNENKLQQEPTSYPSEKELSQDTGISATDNGEGENQFDHNQEVKIVFKLGDVLQCPEDYSIAHCVAKDLKMSAGIATQFKRKFKAVEELRAQKKKVGSVAALKVEGRQVFYLITKEASQDKPTLDDLDQPLQELRFICDQDNILNLAMPKIASGKDGLHWESVLLKIKQHFMGSNTTIHIYDLPTRTLIFGDEFLENVRWRGSHRNLVDIVSLPQTPIDEMINTVEVMCTDVDDIKNIVICLGISPYELKERKSETVKQLIKDAKAKFKNATITLTGVLHSSKQEQTWTNVNDELAEVAKIEQVRFMDPWSWFIKYDYWMKEDEKDTLTRKCITDVESWLTKFVRPGRLFCMK
jgi:hypothetical protein